MSILAFPLPLRLRRGRNSLLRLLFWGAKPSARSGEATRAEVNRKAEALLDAHGSSILRLAYAYLHNLADAEEVLQDTMVKYLQTAPELNGPEHEKAWLLRVAANLSKNRLAYNRVRRADDVDELSETLVGQQREDLSFVWDAVKQLPVKYRDAVHLFYYEGYSTAQIASIVGRPEVTVRSDLRRARIKLKDMLGEGRGDEADL